MIPAEQVRVELGRRSYYVHIGAGCLPQAGELLQERLPGGKLLVIADARVAELHAAGLIDALRRAGIVVELITFEPGEASKSIDTAQRLWSACGEHGIDRSGGIVALGGGVCGDLAGFIAATWMRGIAFVQIPTTLLAMVVSAVGGKTGVNSSAGKNLIGAFKQPNQVLIDPTLLTSMEHREYRAGLAEIVKYGVIRDQRFFDWLEESADALAARDAQVVTHAVAVSCKIKAWYVANDEFEHGVRAELNYGHTFAHALERATGYRRYLHGEAVAIGMGMAVDLAQRIGLLKDKRLRARQRDLLRRFELPTQHRCPEPKREAELLVERTALDKKARAGRSRFVLPRGYGDMAVVVEPDVGAVADAFLAGMKRDKHEPAADSV